MESGCSAEIINSGNHDPGNATNAFMFTEEQITKQLVDMREQTDFMKKFRCALGIALREIKTLRTTASLEHSKIEGQELSSSRKRYSSCSLPSTSTCSDSDLAGKSLATSNVGNASSADSRRCVSCACGDNGDLAILKEYLLKMTFEEGVAVGSKRRSHSVSVDAKSGQRGNLVKLKDSGTLIENSILHIERLKEHVTSRNAAVVRLHLQLTQSRIIRVKREAKLEQKLKEISEWKEKYEKAKKISAKQIKITKGLRLALNAEKQKVKSSENMAHGLEQTRRAFDSLKSQAGQLMALLRDKEYEISQLTSKLNELESNSNGVYLSLPDPMPSQDIVTSQICDVTAAQASDVDAEVQTDLMHCDECRTFRNEAQTWQEKYDRLHADFEDFRFRQRSMDASHQPSYSPVSNQRGPLHDHRNGRRRMHAPYTSPDSYRRVSCPPLRRRLNHETPSHTDRSNHMRTTYAPVYGPHPRPSDILLSPIEENEENVGREGSNFIGEYSRSAAHEDDSVISSHESQHVDYDTPVNFERNPPHDQETMSHGVHHDGIQSALNELKVSASSPVHGYHYAHETSSSIHHELPVVVNTSPEHGSGISLGHGDGNYSLSVDQPILGKKGKQSSTKSLTKSVRPKSSDEFPLHKSYKHSCVTKTSYLEVGASKSPSPSSSVKSTREVEESPLCMNSFIRYSESEDTVSEQSSIPLDDLDFSKETNSVSSDEISPEQNAMSFGVLWHPAMAASENGPQGQPPVWLGTSAESGNFSDTSAPYPLLRPKDVIRVQDVNKSKKSGRQSRCVTYKGHKIDVTDFSIDVFREIIWSLDGGSESADDFIKFLASLAKKLNANSKWAGRHSMGNPKDWLALRGLY